VQWQGIKGNTLDDFKDTKTEAILTPVSPSRSREAHDCYFAALPS